MLISNDEEVNTMKEQYLNIEMEIIQLNGKDVITSSCEVQTPIFEDPDE